MALGRAALRHRLDDDAEQGDGCAALGREDRQRVADSGWQGLDAAMGVWVEQMVALHEAGVELVLVSSGAVAAGMSRLGWTVRPSAMHELQAAAAIGQMGLVQAWESSFAEHSRHTGGRSC